VSAKRLTLLPSDSIVKTGPYDHADWCYEGLLGYIMRQRYELVRTMLSEDKVERLLEIGYGSGIFMPELGKHANQLFGADVHPHAQEVTSALARCGITADLRTADAAALPFPDQYFDIVVGVSSLEFIEDLNATCREIARVLKPNGALIVVTPGASPLLDFGLWLFTRQSAKRDFSGRRDFVVPALHRHFDSVNIIRFPKAVPSSLTIYRALKLRPRLQQDRVITVPHGSAGYR